jgi:methionyl-tRNA formyltransferase
VSHSTRLKIAFFGLPLAAVLLDRDGHEIVYAAACRRAPGLRRLASRIAPGRTSLRPDLTRPAARTTLLSAAPDLLVSWFWTAKLPPEILRIAPGVGVHPSLLPRHRGPDPYFWAIDCGDEVTGVTAHRLDAEYDTGAILGRRELVIEPRWNAWRLARALDRPSLALLREVVRAFREGKRPLETPQDERGVTQAPEPNDDELAIRWSWSTARIERRVRAAAPWPGAWTEVGDRIVTLLRVRPTDDFPRALAPAEAAVRGDGVAVVRAGDGAIELLEGRAGDDDDIPLSGRDLARLVETARG